MKLISLILTVALPSAVLAAPKRHPDYEPATQQTVAPEENLLKGATVSASGHWSTQTPQLAVDGQSDNPDSHWACEQLPAILNVDLGQERKIAALRVWPYWSDGRVYKYKVEGSRDNQSWMMLADHTANSIAATPDGESFRFEPQQLRYLRLTVLDSSKRQAGGHIVEFAAYASLPARGLQGGITTINTRCPQTGKTPLASPTDGIRLTGWRGERVNAQIVVTASTIQRQLRVDPVLLKGAAQSIAGKTYFVRYVLANGKPQPDILDTERMIEQPANANRPVWLSVDIPREAAPGIYKGTLTVRSEIGLLDFPVELEVLPATLPAPKDWAFHLDLWQHPQSVARWHDVTPWSPEHFALMKPLMKRLADAGQKNITCSIIHEPWNAQTFDWFPSMIEWRKKADGTWTFDFTAFDRWVTFMMNDVGITGQIVCYTMVPWHLQFRYYDEATQKFIDLKANPGTPAYDEHWGRFLKDFAGHLKTKGWLEQTAIGMDERPDNLMRPALATLRKYAPALRVVSAVNHPSDITQDVYDLSPIIWDGLSPELLAKRKQAGKKTTYYVCCSPEVPNTFTFSPLAESAWLPLLSAAVGYDGFLRWAYNSWVENPLVSTDFVTWPSGDCFLVYPGNRSSLRFERLRDGIEEFEKIRILRACNLPAINTALDEALKPFNAKRSSQSGIHEADVNCAAKVVEDLSRQVHKNVRSSEFDPKKI
jgi:hypothetical protein